MPETDPTQPIQVPSTVQLAGVMVAVVIAALAAAVAVICYGAYYLTQIRWPHIG